tara:strand:+ start:63 stop:395 length:333 start_codon:yes stop_codon:yes gene_type:complete
MRFGDVFFLLLFSSPSTLASSARARSRLLVRKRGDAIPIFGVRKEEEEEEEGERTRAPEEAMEEERSIIRGALFVSCTFRVRSAFCALPKVETRIENHFCVTSKSISKVI